VPGLRESIRTLDLEDGRLDGRWKGKALGDVKVVFRTPAYAEWQTNVLEELIRREGFGDDRVPDLLFTNYKQIDETGHWWTMHGPEMEAAVRASDDALARLIAVLDREVGRKEWLIVLTADHGVVPGARASGGVQLNGTGFQEDIRAAFDGDGDERDVLERYRPTELWLDRTELEENGFDLRQVAQWVMEYTRGENVAEPERLSRAARNLRPFAAAFPSRMMLRLPCA
jgi:predicted AlkP superfamily pyrophosphatase or phosphodiesterase